MQGWGAVLISFFSLCRDFFDTKKTKMEDEWSKKEEKRGSHIKEAEADKVPKKVYMPKDTQIPGPDHYFVYDDQVTLSFDKEEDEDKDEDEDEDEDEDKD